MIVHEFEVIERYFSPLFNKSSFVQVGPGDDCALFAPAAGFQCAVSTDTLVSGVHFLPNLEPERLAHRALAVNLSDLAAMGAQARAFTLAITLPSIDQAWLRGFSQGLARCASANAVSLMGGDTTRGPLSVTATVFGELRPGCGLHRSGAKVGDDLWVSGILGAAWSGLQVCSQAPAWLNLSDSDRQFAVDAFELPEPRLALGEALQPLGATAALDVSDGVAGDAQHIARASGCTVHIDLDQLPIFEPILAQAPNKETAWRVGLAGGDDYELLFTAPRESRAELISLSNKLGVPLTRIGRICPAGAEPLQLASQHESAVHALRTEALSGYNHFV
jgi:thiamine-monophosphate kinase